MEIAAGLPRPIIELRAMWISTARSRWDQAESLATLRVDDLEAPGWLRRSSAVCLASVHAARGRVRECDVVLDSLRQIETNAEAACELSMYRLFLRLVAHKSNTFASPSADGDTTIAGLVLQGVVTAALSGDPQRAAEIRNVLASKPEFDRRRYEPDVAFLSAWIAAAEGRWGETVRAIGRRTTSGQPPIITGRLPMRWLLGEAHEELGQLQEAVDAFNLVLDPTRLPDRRLGLEVDRFGIPYSFAHQRLVLLYSKMGRVEDARRHWEIFENTFTNPDPELVPMIEEARQALAQAEATL